MNNKGADQTANAQAGLHVCYLQTSKDRQGQKYFNNSLVLHEECLTIFTCPANTCTCFLKAHAIRMNALGRITCPFLISLMITSGRVDFLSPDRFSRVEAHGKQGFGQIVECGHPG